MVEQVPEIHFSGNIQPIKGVGVKWNGVFLHFFITKLMIFQTSTASLLHFTLKNHHKYMYYKEKNHVWLALHPEMQNSGFQIPIPALVNMEGRAISIYQPGPHSGDNFALRSIFFDINFAIFLLLPNGRFVISIHYI